MEDTKYTLGLDVGISSVGWSVVEIDETNGSYIPKRLLQAGIRSFTTAETPKEGKSLNLVRRDSRSSRKRLKRRRVRLSQLKDLLRSLNFIKDINNLNTNFDIWEARSFALDNKLDPISLSKVILHISKHRGFKSNRKHDPEDGGGKFSEFIKLNKEQMNAKGYRTYGEMLFKDSNYTNQKRNRDGNYQLMIDRESLKDELTQILNKQKEYYHQLDQTVIDQILAIFSDQKPFATAEMIDSMVGSCQLEKEEKRAPVNSYTFELFRLHQKLSNLRIQNFSSYEESQLSKDQRELLVVHLHEKKGPITYSQLRKLLDLTDDFGFPEIGWQIPTKRDEYEKKNKLPNLSGYHAIKKALIDDNLQEEWEKIRQNTEILDEIATILTLNKTDEDIVKGLSKLNIENNVIQSLLKIIEFKKFGNLSIKAINKILPHIKEGYSYTEACIKAGYISDEQGNKVKKLPPFDPDDIRNPVVIRSLAQTRKVINAIIDKFGSPTFIHIEMARDLGKSYKDRREILKNQEENQLKNEKIVTILKEEFGLADPSGKDIQIYKLWKEQQEKSIYSQVHIVPERLFEPNYAQIDHAIPFSRSLNDSYHNKVLCLTEENQNKKNLTPYEFLDGKNNSSKWQSYKSYVNSLNEISHKKRENLLSKKSYEELNVKNFLERDLNDTRYISKDIKKHIEMYLRLNPSTTMKRQVYTYNGRFTAELRRLWHLSKNREENNRHHALDATVLASASFGMVQKITNYLNGHNGYDKLEIPMPWDSFDKDISIRIFSTDPIKGLQSNGLISRYEDIKDSIKPILVSKPPRKKITGPAHAETIYSPKLVNDGYFIKRVDVKSITEKDLPNIYGNDTNLIESVKEYISNFPDPKDRTDYPRKKSKSGEGNIIKKVKLKEAANLYVEVHDGKGVAANGSMVRVDVFEKDNKNYLVPVYVHNLTKNAPLPMLTTGSKGKKKLLDDSYKFKFSLHPDDYLEIQDKDDVLEGYYVSTGSNNGAISYILHDTSQRKNVLTKNVLTVKSFKKCNISVLGDKSYISSEFRQKR